MKLLRSKKVTDYKYLNMFELEYLDREGKERSWQLASRQSEPRCVTRQFTLPDGVVMVPFHISRQCLVLIREYRVSVGDYQYGFPAGLIDTGENMSEAIERELKEETGLDLVTITRSSPPLYSSSGLTDESIVMVYIECDGVPTNQYNESSEDIETLFISPDQAEELCQNSEVKIDVKTWLVLAQYAKTGTIF